MRSFISLLVAVMLVLSLAVGVSADDTTANTYVIDFTSEAALIELGGSINLSNNNDTEQPNGLSYFTTVNGVGCLQLEYNLYTGNNATPYRVQPRLGNAWDGIGSSVESDRLSERPTMDHIYMTVTYMTTETDPYQLIVYNAGPRTVATVLDEDTSVNAGKFVTTNPVDISEASNPDNIIKRLNQGNHISLEFTSWETDSEIYIKEIRFFTTEAQAQAYADAQNGTTTDAPETDAPVTDAPETDAPETDAPVTDAPETDAPVTDAPTTDAPATDAPETDAPTTGGDTTSPSTFDVAVIAAVLTAASGAAFVVASKKRK